MKKYILIVLVIIVPIFGYLGYNYFSYESVRENVQNKIENTAVIEEAYFAAGCFWCTESAYEKYKPDGVIDVISGYAGGKEENPTYKEVSASKTGHRESVKVLYDPSKISYNDLLEIFWRTADPTDSEGQYVDKGFQYTSAIFYTDEEEYKLALESKKKLEESGRLKKEIATKIIKYTSFYPAEDYHQDYYIKNPVRYNGYTGGSGRKERIAEIWGDDKHYVVPPKNPNPLSGASKEKLKQLLTPLQYKVTQENGTEKPFDNEYWDNKREGIYVDLIDGTPLYSSKDKYVSGTGWPSFTKPIDKNNIVEKEDNTLFTTRTEIRGKYSDSHIGHVFNDGPKDKGGLRYCMNSAAMKFIAVEDLEKEGYGEYLEMFR